MSPTRSSSRTARCGAQREYLPESTSRWPSWRPITATTSPGASPSGWSSTCAAPAASSSSAPTWARRVNVSPRHLARLFRDEAGSTPGAVVERMRIQAAVEQLVHTDAPLPTVAARSGFGSVAGLHRSFVRHHGLSPGEYRRRFTVRPLGPGGTTDRSA
ncbi:helix-turn-helix domain-containing protein [Rhodococcus sp. BE178]|uniref:helix-turn-helix domain-containing protein n=1 Tax=Rhodococcus sp. BE178 TaxID=2817737 RepID=UPI003D24BB91